MDSQKPGYRNNRVRLHKYLAGCGIGSRRACERLIESGRISVDGRIVRTPGTCVDASVQTVEADGKRVEPERKTTILLNKPTDVLCTSADPRNRRTFKALLPPMSARLFTVGRLDRESEGLLLVTNDGDLAFTLTHPGFQVEKVYRASLDRCLTGEEQKRARTGVRVRNETLKAGSVKFIEKRKDAFIYEIRLREGRNRHIRRLFAAFGINVIKLKRTELGPLKLGGLRSGEWRYIQDSEMTALRNHVKGKGGVP